MVGKLSNKMSNVFLGRKKYNNITSNKNSGGSYCFGFFVEKISYENINHFMFRVGIETVV
jgi:hypothetical protein